MSADIGSRNTVPMVLPRMSDIRCVAAVATACGGSSYTPQGHRHSDRDHRQPGRNCSHRRSRSSRRGDYHYRQFQPRRPLTVSPAQLSASPITTRPRIPSRPIADRWPVRCAPRRQWGSNVHGTNPAGRVCLLLHVSPVDEGHADRPVANLQVARETRLTPTAASSCPALRDAYPRHPAVAQFARAIAKSRFDIRRRCGRDPFQQLVIPHRGPLR